jgi:F0F1-type ATP synthase membrane subunit b/b'
LESIKEAHEKSSLSIGNSRKKLYKNLEVENDNFEKENAIIITKFEKELLAKKESILADKQKIAYEISHDIIKKIIGENSLIEDNIKYNITRISKN